jgi:hypothetical protein
VTATVFWRCTVFWHRHSQAWGSYTTVSFLCPLDLQSIFLCLVFVFIFQLFLFSVLFFTFLIHKKQRNSVEQVLSPMENTIVRTSNFKQLYGESLKDAWFRLNHIHKEDPNPCEKEKMHLYFYYGLGPWYKNALDFASGGSFVLSSPK